MVPSAFAVACCPALIVTEPFALWRMTVPAKTLTVMLPWASIRKIVGQPCTPHWVGITPEVPFSPHEKLRQVIFSSLYSFFFSCSKFESLLRCP